MNYATSHILYVIFPYKLIFSSQFTFFLLTVRLTPAFSFFFLLNFLFVVFDSLSNDFCSAINFAMNEFDFTVWYIMFITWKWLCGYCKSFHSIFRSSQHIKCFYFCSFQYTQIRRIRVPVCILLLLFYLFRWYWPLCRRNI